MYHLISPGIPASQPGWADSLRAGPVGNSYAGVFFTDARIRDKSWVRYRKGTSGLIYLDMYVGE